MFVSVDGKLGSDELARVSPLDHGLLVGDGVFETLRVYDGTPFAWRRHIERLERSAEGLGLHVPDRRLLRERADEVLSANDLADARLRITVTGGPSPLGSERGDTPPTVIVAASPVTPWPPTTMLVTVPWPRNERGAVTGLKTISYAENVRALAYAAERGGGEALFTNTVGDVCEGTGANIFAVLDGTLTTPPEESGCLPGVTRALTLEIAAAAGIPTSVVRIRPEELLGASEVFVTSSTREIQPVDRIDDTPFGAPGPLTERLAEAFSELVRTTPDP
ncbi:MAG: aminotransferase class IV [Acidimicrobiia bacterium]|nr:aminotransferase class IV [Acidimicrobiia bacterium]